MNVPGWSQTSSLVAAAELPFALLSSLVAAEAILCAFQYELLDFMTCLICLVAITYPAAPKLYAAKPIARLMSRAAMLPGLLLVALMVLQQGVGNAVVRSMSWFDSSGDQVSTAYQALHVSDGCVMDLMGV